MLLAAMTTTAPTHLRVSRGAAVVDVPLIQWRGDGPLLSLVVLARALGATVQRHEPWTILQTPSGDFRFLMGTPVIQDGAEVRGLPCASRQRGDSLFVPLAFVAEVLGDTRRAAWIWAPGTLTLTEGRAPMLLGSRPPVLAPGNQARGKSADGLRAGHRVTIDPGHGGTDPGNPGMFFPHGLKEKDVTLDVALLVRDELEKRGVRVTMTRTTDTLINLGQRAPKYCKGDCDLFVSIHVNSLNPRPGFQQVRGFETYFLSEARDEDAARVARMENGAVRFDNPAADSRPASSLDFMFKDLQSSEFLRGSQQAAAFIQSYLDEVHDGRNQGVKQAGFAVLTTARRPSVLIEIGYATNREDAALMTGREGQRKLASSIALAIVAYLKQHDREISDTSTGGEP